MIHLLKSSDHNYKISVNQGIYIFNKLQTHPVLFFRHLYQNIRISGLGTSYFFKYSNWKKGPQNDWQPSLQSSDLICSPMTGL